MKTTTIILLFAGITGIVNHWHGAIVLVVLGLGMILSIIEYVKTEIK
jgi:putative Mn2+ efflux pump MntP